MKCLLRNRRHRRFASGVLLLVAAMPSQQTPAAELADTIERIKPAIVGVGTMQHTRRPPGKFVGTGFIVADGLHVLTNAHVIPESFDEGSHEFLAVLASQGEGVRKARVVKVDPDHDVALLRIEGARLPALRLGNSRHVREGQLYAFTGFPIGMVLGMRPVTHRGIVSAITPIVIPQLSARQLDSEMIRRLRTPFEVFQLDATAYPGNSGSPLYDPANGQVVGILNLVFVKESKEAVLEKPSGISYAIPIEHARALLHSAGLRED